MNPESVSLASILVAALGGLAVGLERQSSGHATGENARFAGVRTFALLGMLSGLSGWLWIHQFQAMAVVLVAGPAAVVVFAYSAASRRDVDATTEVAALVVLGAGVTAGIGQWAVAGGVFAVTAILLVEKSRLHKIAQRIDDTALRAGVRFGVMAIVILPLLPEGPFGPWGGIRPRTLWVAVLIFSGLSFLGYIARKALPGSSGYVAAGILGGMISSTSVTLSFSRMSRAGPFGTPLALGVIGASTILFLRVAVAVLALNAELARAAVRFLVLPLVAGAAITAFGLRRSTREAETETQAAANPLQFWASLQMAALFQGVFYLVTWMGKTWGSQGLLLSGAILGLTDVDALTISMARGGHGGSLDVAAAALSLGILSNTALKVVVTLAFGKGRFRWLAASGLAMIGFALALSLLLFR
jgi:uncharacterized membrane protein (DUF4010 family)